MVKRNGNIILELLLALGLAGMAAYGMSDAAGYNSKAKEAEVKANLHNIQLSCERFAVDTEGFYPSYLIGGEARYAAQVDPMADQPFAGIQDYPTRDLVSDPLLRMGYLDAYPRNPFVRNGESIHLIQDDLPSALDGCDPLRNGPGSEGAQGAGTRFGAECNAMGNVFADPRYGSFTARDYQTGSLVQVDTWAMVEYDFWDMWIGEKPLPYLPGEFFYKGAGPIPVDWRNQPAGKPHPSATTPQEPAGTDQYMLAGFGGPRTEGMDEVGDEQPLLYRYTGAGVQPGQTFEVWSWTRSEVSADLADVGGCPFRPVDASGPQYPDTIYSRQYSSGIPYLEHGNPNGINDALIITLSSGIRQPYD